MGWFALARRDRSAASGPGGGAPRDAPKVRRGEGEKPVADGPLTAKLGLSGAVKRVVALGLVGLPKWSLF